MVFVKCKTVLGKRDMVKARVKCAKATTWVNLVEVKGKDDLSLSNDQESLLRLKKRISDMLVNGGINLTLS